MTRSVQNKKKVGNYRNYFADHGLSFRGGGGGETDDDYKAGIYIRCTSSDYHIAAAKEEALYIVGVTREGVAEKSIRPIEPCLEWLAGSWGLD